MRFLLYLLLLVILSGKAFSQGSGLHIKKTKGKIAVDGEMNEPDWQSAEFADRFRQFFPFDSSAAKCLTEVRMTYDEHFIYVFAKMKRLYPGKFVTPSLRRDFRGEAYDAFVVQFDTYKDRTNAVQFGVNPFGVQREGLVSNGGTNPEDLSLDWDNKWYSEAKIVSDGGWVCEFAIPFKTVRYKHGLDSWYINFYRIDTQLPERSTWSPISRVYPMQNLATSRELIWDNPLPHPGTNVSLIPYAAARSVHDFEDASLNTNQPAVGGDAKIALGPALNLDLTVNPDFSQVEVDQQVTNLNRFEIFYPEKRQFFLENGDLFANFGYSNMRPFFSRRIGVTRDPSTGQNIQNQIYGGFRLSGKINNNVRIGAMSMQAAEDNTINLPSINYTVAAIQRKVFSRSNIGLILINKQSFVDTSYNRLIGIDYNLASRDNRWTGKAFYHRSFDQLKKDSTYAASAQLTYQVPNIELDFLAQDVGANYNPEVGYTPRKRFKRFAPEAYYSFYPKSKIINKHGPGTDLDFIWNDLYGMTDWDANLWYRITFQNTAQFYTRIRRDFTYLFTPFDPSGSGGLQAPAGSSYYYNSVILFYQSNARKKLFYSFQSRIGEYFNGHRQNIDGTISYRLQPHAVISMNFTYNRIRLPLPYNSSDLLLLGPKFDLTFSRKLFWTTYFQYNNQINNLNINSRLQWRFKPVSDLFIVYTDNYFAETSTHDQVFYVGQPKLRALVLKLTYWINL